MTTRPKLQCLPRSGRPPSKSGSTWKPRYNLACSYCGCRSTVSAEITEGARWILGHKFLRPLTGAVVVFHLGTSGALSLLVLLTTEVIGASDAVFGLVLLAGAVGATGSSLIAASLTDRFSPYRRVIGPVIGPFVMGPLL